MKALISILILLVLGVGTVKLIEYWNKVEADKDLAEKERQGENIDGSRLQGMPWELEQNYREAQAKGPSGVKKFLEAYSKAPKFKDPRLGWIQLDYAVSILTTDPVEARAIFNEVKNRVKTNSVIYPRIRSMEKNFQ
jgi:hypothetical protein